MKCEFCENEGEREERETLNNSSSNLIWLCPDEKWICNSCLNKKSRAVIRPS